MSETLDAVERYLGQGVVLDMVSEYVLLGTLDGYDGRYLHLTDADVHDLRQSGNTRDAYIDDAVKTGIHVNRKRLLVRREEIICISALTDVTS